MEASERPDKSCTRDFAAERRGISFPDGKEVLSVAPLQGDEGGLPAGDPVVSDHCKVRRAPATVMLVKEYLPGRERQGAKEARVALRWFFQQGRLAPAARVLVLRSHSHSRPSTSRIENENEERERLKTFSNPFWPRRGAKSYEKNRPD